MINPDVVRDYLRLQLEDQGRELFMVLFLDGQNRLVMSEVMFSGTITETRVHPREIVKQALAYNAAAVICARNHPSGVAEPSEADYLITEKIKDALELIGVRLVDHLVIGRGESVSFAERGRI